jgi:hypothetical protein
VLSTASCLLIGYPFAYLMTVVPGRVAGLLAIAVLLPFWSSLLVRTFAWQVILRDTGIINRFLESLGVISEPLPLIRTTAGVIIGMSHILLPFMVLPIWAVMRRIDPEYSRAAANLGASPARAFVRVVLPLSLPGVLAGCLLVVRPGARLLHHAGAPGWPSRPDDQPADRPAGPAASGLGLRDGDERGADAHHVRRPVRGVRAVRLRTSSAARGGLTRERLLASAQADPHGGTAALTVFYLLARRS